MNRIISIIKHVLFLKDTDNLSVIMLLKRWNIKFGPYFYHRYFGTNEIIQILKDMGINKGSNIFIHSAWDSFYRYTGNEKELLEALISLIGETGTIAMPAFPIEKKGVVFNVKKTPTAAGRLNEIFRRYPNVRRSCYAENSVCALGPLAEYLTCDHQKSIVRWDECSPYYRICEKHFTVVKLGLPYYFIGSFEYVSKAIMRHKVPYFAQFYNEDKKDVLHYIDNDGNDCTYLSVSEPYFFSRKSYFWVRHIIKKYIPKDKYLCDSISNLNISCIDAYFIHNKLCELAKKNVFLYNYPLIKKSQRL